MSFLGFGGSTTTSDGFKDAVDAMPVNVMFCELNNFTITYANKLSIETLKKVQDLIPCQAGEIVGQCIDIFHKAPEKQRALLRDPGNLPYSTVITLGPEKMSLLVTAIYDSAGRYTSAMLTWDIITEKYHMEQQNERLQDMANQMPINVMMVELEDLSITYMNETSKKTLKQIEHLLPCRADEVLGQSIDIFHKNPSHQRHLLADDKNLPHKAKIMLGDEHLDLLVNPVYDNEGNYINAMLTWSVITDQVTFASEVRHVVELVASSATEMRATSEGMANTASQANDLAGNVATTSQELSASISEISGQVTRSSDIAGTAVEEANRADEMIQGLDEASQKIGEVVGLITDIAEQTNLLALNATIEAARAGDAGKGFAVVASEVKNLASQTARATEEISAQITGIQGATQDAVKAIQGIAGIIGEINEIASAIASAVEEQSAATQEVTANIDGVSQASDETGTAASEVLEAASELSRQSEQLSSQIDNFLG